MTRAPSLTRKAASVQQSVGEIRRRVQLLSCLLLREGVSEKVYRHLMILRGELGSMAELPVRFDGQTYYLPEDEDAEVVLSD